VSTAKIGVLLVGVFLAGLAAAWASTGAEKLPAGPIRDRYELMEEIGSHAKNIGNTIRAGKTDGVAESAKAIRDRSERIPGLFPAGSTHPNSRAKDEIWTDWQGFEEDASALSKAAAELGQAAQSGQDVGPVSRRMFEACKSCHQRFRKPEK